MVILHTNHGPITIELDAAHAPKSVTNFLEYVRVLGHFVQVDVLERQPAFLAGSVVALDAVALDDIGVTGRELVRRRTATGGQQGRGQRQGETEYAWAHQRETPRI